MILEERVQELEKKVQEIEHRATFHITELYRLLKVGDDNNTDHINRVQADLAFHINGIKASLNL